MKIAFSAFQKLLSAKGLNYGSNTFVSLSVGDAFQQEPVFNLICTIRDQSFHPQKSSPQPQTINEIPKSISICVRQSCQSFADTCESYTCASTQMAHTFRCFWARTRAHSCNYVCVLGRSSAVANFLNGLLILFARRKWSAVGRCGFFIYSMLYLRRSRSGRPKHAIYKTTETAVAIKSEENALWCLCVCVCARLLQANITQRRQRRNFGIRLHSQKFVIHILICARRCYIHKIFNYSIYTLFVWFVFV